MKTVKRLKDVNALEQFEMLLDKARNEPQIARLLEKYGYNEAILNQGVEFLLQAKQKYKESIDMKDAFSYAQSDFTQKRAALDRYYKDHKGLAHIIFVDDQFARDRLGIHDKHQLQFWSWLDAVRKFYLAVDEDQGIQEKFVRYGQAKEAFEAGLEKIEELEALYAKKMRAVGDMRLATAEKNEAFKTLHQWVRVFIRAARIALRDEPRLMATLERHL